MLAIAVPGKARQMPPSNLSLKATCPLLPMARLSRNWNRRSSIASRLSTVLVSITSNKKPSSSSSNKAISSIVASVDTQPKQTRLMCLSWQTWIQLSSEVQQTIQCPKSLQPQPTPSSNSSRTTLLSEMTDPEHHSTSTVRLEAR